MLNIGLLNCKLKETEMVLRWIREFRQRERNRIGLEAFMRTEYRNEYHRLKDLGICCTEQYVLDLYNRRTHE